VAGDGADIGHAIAHRTDRTAAIAGDDVAGQLCAGSEIADHPVAVLGRMLGAMGRHCRLPAAPAEVVAIAQRRRIGSHLQTAIAGVGAEFVVRHILTLLDLESGSLPLHRSDTGGEGSGRTIENQVRTTPVGRTSAAEAGREAAVHPLQRLQGRYWLRLRLRLRLGLWLWLRLLLRLL